MTDFAPFIVLFTIPLAPGLKIQITFLASALSGVVLGPWLAFLRGAAADVIVMDYKPFTPFSDTNIDGHMIFGMTGRQCQTTIASGKLLMLDRELVGIDEEAENAHILEASKKLWGALNNRTY